MDNHPLPGVVLRGAHTSTAEKVLSREALTFVTALVRCFRGGLGQLLAAREARQLQFDRGARPHFLPETEGLRQRDWIVAPLPQDLLDRRVELTAPPDRKRMIKALNSGARVYVADFDDGLAPTLNNLLEGQENLGQAIRRTLRHEDPRTGKGYELEEKVATLMVRPRGLHLQERHLLVDGEPAPACLFDAGLFLFHNARELRARGTGPYLYLSKLEHHLEARWWNQVLEAVENDLELPQGTIRTTVLIDTLPAAFQMEEILHEHLNRVLGLKLGHRDYLFSYLKTLRTDPLAVLPDPGSVPMEQPLLQACAQLLVRTCHRHGCLAIGGTSAFAPPKGDAEGTFRAWEQLRSHKRREVLAGCDGTGVAHPGQVAVALAAFDAQGAEGNQIRRMPGPVNADRLLAAPQGARTQAGLRQNLRVGIRYLEAWLRGQGCVALDGLVEDAASAELARMQLWQWIRHEVEVEGLGRLDHSLFHAFVQETLIQLRAEIEASAFEGGPFMEAADLFETLILAETPAGFLTLQAYPMLLNAQPVEVMP